MGDYLEQLHVYSAKLPVVKMYQPCNDNTTDQTSIEHKDIEGAKIDCLSLFMCPLLAQLKIGFFSSFSDAAVYSTNEANKAGLKQSIIFRCL